MDNGHVSLFSIFFCQTSDGLAFRDIGQFLTKHLGLSNYLLKIEQIFLSIFITASFSHKHKDFCIAKNS